ncbi:hypothetical protein POM88_013428 [Heracleum sosnowskyi]|uniref:DUF4283 domain-containing protein n=1 Tax=Heracleum sosnowskyi TaxID=360622 RepID=A0AAD8IYF9_9APIA|nr:hypothetical protein POM88_013428 [Heracleum sosnowskyi]
MSSGGDVGGSGGSKFFSNSRGDKGFIADNLFVDLSTSVHVSKVNNEKSKSKASVEGEYVEPEASRLDSENGKHKSWSQVVKNSHVPCDNLTFHFLPPPIGDKIISPPVEVLIKGNEKYKTCIMGVLTHASLPFHKVSAFTNQAWKSRGLTHVSQKDICTFVFKFDTFENRNSVLSRGTWYLGNQPMIVMAWGAKIGDNTTFPLWVRFDNIPDNYWSRECLSLLGSVIGNPLYTYEHMSRLEILHFGKLCVEYKIGNELPNKIEVEVLDPVIEEIRIEEVKASNPVVHESGDPTETIEVEQKEHDGEQHTGTENLESNTGSKEQDAVPLNTANEEWHTIQHQKSKLVVANASTGQKVTVDHSKSSTSPKLPIYSSLANSIHKGKAKRAKGSGGRNSPHH